MGGSAAFVLTHTMWCENQLSTWPLIGLFRNGLHVYTACHHTQPLPHTSPHSCLPPPLTPAFPLPSPSLLHSLLLSPSLHSSPLPLPSLLPLPLPPFLIPLPSPSPPNYRSLAAKEDPAVLYLLSALYFNTGRADRAAAVAERLLAVDPLHHDGLCTYVCVHCAHA